MKSIKKIAVFISLVVIAAGCANIVTPTGGKKDTTPPKLLSAEPDTFSTNFSTRKITLEFDENVVINDPTQILISPPQEKAPTVKIRGKRIFMELNDSLRKNTTYTINFGDAIKDVTEGNKLDNFQYVFSTGNFIDSLEISGTASFSADNKREKGVVVMLYKDLNDSIIYRKKPDFFTRTDESGAFILNYLHAGKYRIYALKDQNLNFLFDQPNEAIAFVQEPLVIRDSVKSIALNLFVEEPKKLFLTDKYSNEFGKLTLIFNRPVNNFQIVESNIKNSHAQEIFEWSDSKDTLRYWFNQPYLDSTHIILQADGLRDTVTTTIKAVEKDSLAARKNRLQLATSAKTKGKTIQKSKPANSAQDIYKDFTIEFNHPLSSFDAANIHLYEDSETVVNPQISIDPLHSEKLLMKFDWLEGTQYKVVMDAGSVTDFFGLKNEKIEIPFTTTKSEDYGKIILTLSGLDSSKQYILKLLNDKDQLQSSELVSHESELKRTYENLNPGGYKIKIVQDENKNGKWDTGNYLQHLQPEKIVFYQGTINVKSNWDLEIEMDYTQDGTRLSKKL